MTAPSLAPTWFIDADSPAVGDFARDSAAGATDPTEVAVALFHAVRDGIRYDPYGISYDPAAFRASSVVASPSNWCVPKSVLLTAAARRLGIPARLGFADVRNHLTSEKLSATMGTDLFAWHGYSELLLPDPAAPGTSRWFKLSTAFNIELCERFGVKVLEFDGTADALMHPFDQAGRRHMEYVRDRGSYDDLPLDDLLADFAEIYGTAFGGANDVHSAAEAGDDAFGP
ncbi:MAG: transglutaminase family protein [Ilumatobacter sp.]|uniref:transglutaminase-like domain-containing protein n=1 Tax=Ilumatobacter sp. TaxID=1967498 RepID=UPI002615FCC4|nr:transglutaminase family protein [Ilumatobacter sp.]MDJ0771654.1 transglutaminase family protein [Ilumatobacter sp.]